MKYHDGTGDRIVSHDHTKNPKSNSRRTNDGGNKISSVPPKLMGLPVVTILHSGRADR